MGVYGSATYGQDLYGTSGSGGGSAATAVTVGGSLVETWFWRLKRRRWRRLVR